MNNFNLNSICDEQHLWAEHSFPSHKMPLIFSQFSTAKRRRPPFLLRTDGLVSLHYSEPRKKMVFVEWRPTLPGWDIAFSPLPFKWAKNQENFFRKEIILHEAEKQNCSWNGNVSKSSRLLHFTEVTVVNVNALMLHLWFH